MMNFTPITGSSRISQIGYDGETGELGVIFQNGAVYHYQRVPRRDAENFMLNPVEGSHGKHLQRFIIPFYTAVRQ